MSYEFVVHVADEYDYRYASADKRDKILENIAHSYVEVAGNKLLAFYFKVNIT